MRTTIAARAGRLLGQTAAVALVALLLAGLAAAPAGARTRDDGRKEANDFIAWCFGEGGNPIVVEGTGDDILVACDFPDGKDLTCQFYPVYDCWSRRVIPGDFHNVDLEQTDAPVARPDLADPTGVGGTFFVEDGATETPLRAAGGASGRITILGGSAVAEVIAIPDLGEDEIVTTQPVPPAVAAPIIVPELEEDEVVTTQPVPAPVAEEIDVPEIEDDQVVTIQPVLAPVAEEIVVPELEEDDVVTTQPVLEPVAEEITVPETADDVMGTTASVPAADEEP
jgi:hypothetical protein